MEKKYMHEILREGIKDKLLNTRADTLPLKVTYEPLAGRTLQVRAATVYHSGGGTHCVCLDHKGKFVARFPARYTTITGA